MKYCPFCGAGLQDAMVFCPKCGKKFLDAVENAETIGQLDMESNLPEYPEEPTQEPVSTQVVDDLSEVESVLPTEPERRSVKRNIKIGLALLSIVVIFAVIAAFAFSGKKDGGSKISMTDAANSVLYLEACDNRNHVIATASGFVIEEGTTLVTNFHVIDGVHHIVAHMPDGEKSVEICTVLAYDAYADLAILECEESIGVQPLVLGDSDAVKQGDKVYAVGYPLGLANTLSDGVISSRYLDEHNIDILQITAPISSGSSGGALLNEYGEVIGVICASYVNGQNMNIAISAAEVNRVRKNCQIRITLQELYDNYRAPSISRANLSGGGIVTENDDYVFFIDETTERLGDSDFLIAAAEVKEAYIWQYSKENGSLKSLPIRASKLNIYNGKLYYYDYEMNDICCCEIGETFGEHIQSLDLTEGLISSMFFLNGKLILQKGSYSIKVYDAETLDILASFDSYYNLTYLEDTVYMVSDSSICALNTKTLESQEYSTPSSLYEIYPLSNGKIYCQENVSPDWIEAYGQTIYVFDTKTGSFSTLLTCGTADILLCKNGTVLLHEYSDNESDLFDISSGEKILFPNQNVKLSKRFMKGFVIEGDYNIPKLGWPSDAIFGNYRSNGESSFIIP